MILKDDQAVLAAQNQNPDDISGLKVYGWTEKRERESCACDNGMALFRSPTDQDN
jgi:hypothetical protein